MNDIILIPMHMTPGHWTTYELSIARSITVYGSLNSYVLLVTVNKEQGIDNNNNSTTRNRYRKPP